MGRSHLATLRECRDVELVGACDADSEVLRPLSAEGVATHTDYRDLIHGVEADCAIVSLPHYLYPGPVNAALEMGLHVLKEKPFARTLDDARAMLGTSRRTSRILMVAGQAKHYPSFRKAKQLLDAGMIGKILVCRAIITYRWAGAISGNWSWRGEHEKSGGVAVIDSGWHMLDLVHWYCGVPSRVSCFLGRGRALPGDYDVDDRAVVSLEFPGGAVGTVTACFITQPTNRQIVLHGLEGALDITGERLVDTAPDGSQTVEEFAEGSHSLAPQLATFIDAVREGSAGPALAEDAYQVQRIIDAAYRSAEEGRAVALRD
jgi:predicted dehydrogenase